MIPKNYSSFAVRLAIPALGLFLSGCALFSSIGGWFSQRYENTTSYFNAYYNASRIFNEAEKEVIDAQLSARGKTTPANSQTNQISPTAKQKFTTVIDKCSNILSFYPRSSYVEDALFLIGKSYYYQGEYLKAERKFSELVAQYPAGSLTLEGQLWFLKTLQRLDRFDDANKAAEGLIEEATREDEEDIVGEAYRILGEIAQKQNAAQKAIEHYTKAIEFSDDDFLRGTVQAKIGDLYVVLEDYEKAATAYLRVGELTSDPYLFYYSRLHAAITYRSLKKYDSTFALFTYLLDDYRFNDYVSTVRFELGKTFVLSGQVEDAVDEYRFVDTTYARTEMGAKAAFELGRLLELQLGEYEQAKGAYEHATFGSTLPEAAEAQRRSAALTKYFQLHKQFAATDSVFYAQVIDTLSTDKDSLIHSKPDDSLAVKDSTRNKALAIDSSAVAKDSTFAIGKTDSLTPHVQTLAPQKVKLNKDSLRVVLSSIANELGELFYAELDVADSSLYWYQQSLELHVDSTKAPRAFFLMAEIIRANPQNTYGDANDLYRKLIRDFPSSQYVDRAKVALGEKLAPKATDPAEPIYAQAESLIVLGNYQEAVDTLRSIPKNYQDSPLVGKSRLAIAWLYENHLSQPDSALVYYKKVVEKNGATKYASIAKRRIPPEEPAAADTSMKTSIPDSLMKTSVPDSLMKTSVAPADTSKPEQLKEPQKKGLKFDPDEERPIKAPKDSVQTRRRRVDD